MHDRILILDFGAQYTQLIARRVREAKVYCEIHPCDVSDDFVREFAPKGVILSGSHLSAYDASTLKAPKAVFESGIPVLGICYGMQTTARTGSRSASARAPSAPPASWPAWAFPRSPPSRASPTRSRR